MRKNKVTYKTIVVKPTLQPTFWDEAYPLEVSRSDDRFWPILNIARKLNTSTGWNLTLVLVASTSRKLLVCTGFPNGTPWSVLTPVKNTPFSDSVK